MFDTSHGDCFDAKNQRGPCALPNLRKENWSAASTCPIGGELFDIVVELNHPKSSYSNSDKPLAEEWILLGPKQKHHEYLQGSATLTVPVRISRRPFRRWHPWLCLPITNVKAHHPQLLVDQSHLSLRPFLQTQFLFGLSYYQPMSSLQACA